MRRAVLIAVAGALTALWASHAEAFETRGRAAVVMDFRTGAVLFAKNADEPIAPASMSKLMTAYLVFERLREGSLRLDDTLPVSEKAWRITGSEMFVKIGERARVEDLIRGMIVQSGNDACIVFAEALAGSEAAFAERMNEKARELGLTRSHFVNATGLPDPAHKMSVRDLATLARLLIGDFPEHYGYYSEKEFTYAGIKQPNRNPLLQAGVPGVDGIKTGYTEEAGYGLAASAVRDGRRLITVVTGLPDMRSRSSDAELLMEFAFQEFRDYQLLREGEQVAEAAVWHGGARTVPLVAAGPVGISLARDARKGLVMTARFETPVPAPIAAGQRLGELTVEAPGMEPLLVPLVAGATVPRAGVVGRLTGALEYLVWGAS